MPFFGRFEFSSVRLWRIWPHMATKKKTQISRKYMANISLPAKVWLGNGLERPVKSSHPGAKIINDQIQGFYIEFRKRISDLELSGWTKTVKASDIKKRFWEGIGLICPRISRISTNFFGLHIYRCILLRNHVGG